MITRPILAEVAARLGVGGRDAMVTRALRELVRLAGPSGVVDRDLWARAVREGLRRDGALSIPWQGGKLAIDSFSTPPDPIAEVAMRLEDAGVATREPPAGPWLRLRVAPELWAADILPDQEAAVADLDRWAREGRVPDFAEDSQPQSPLSELSSAVAPTQTEGPPSHSEFDTLQPAAADTETPLPVIPLTEMNDAVDDVWGEGPTRDRQADTHEVDLTESNPIDDTPWAVGLSPVTEVIEADAEGIEVDDDIESRGSIELNPEASHPMDTLYGTTDDEAQDDGQLGVGFVEPVADVESEPLDEMIDVAEHSAAIDLEELEPAEAEVHAIEGVDGAPPPSDLSEDFVPDRSAPPVERAQVAQPPASILRGEGLTKIYRNRSVVDEVDIEVAQGEIVGLLGPNGAGKTTSFYMMVGLIAPDGGKVFLDGKDISRMPMYRRARMGVGYLAQEPSVFRKLSVEDNVLAILETLGLKRAERKKRLEELLSELSITHLRKNKAYSLSGGERRRLEITRAMVQQPRFMLLDEPFAGIDPIAVSDIQQIIASLKTRGIGVMISDHNVEQTLEIVDRAYIMYEGRIRVSGTVSELVWNDDVANIYLGPTLTERMRKRFPPAAADEGTLVGEPLA